MGSESRYTCVRWLLPFSLLLLQVLATVATAAAAVPPSHTDSYDDDFYDELGSQEGSGGESSVCVS